MYKFYLGGVLFPIAPEKVTTKIENKNITADLLAGGEVSIPKKPGLTEFSFDVLLPNNRYPFAIYKDKYRNAKYYLDKLEAWKKKKSKIQFILIRKTPKANLFNTNVKVTIEDYNIIDDVEEGTDITVSITLKQYVYYSTKKVVKKKKKKKTKKKRAVTPKKTKKKSTKKKTSSSPVYPQVTTYTVQSGDSLWKISQKFYGNGASYTNIYNANSGTIEAVARQHGKASSSNGHWIYPGTVLTIP